MSYNIDSSHKRPSMMGTPYNSFSHHRRASTNASLLAPPGPPSIYYHSRQPSLYQISPLVTPNTIRSHDASPVPASGSSHSPGESPSLPPTDGNNSPSQGDTLGEKLSLTPVSTSVGTSEESEVQPSRTRSPRRPTGRSASTPAIRQLAYESVPSTESQTPRDSPHNSPRGSLNSLPTNARGSSMSSLRAPAMSHRPTSVNSLSSSRYLHLGPTGGAPHQGRPIALEMPRLLGAKPDMNGDYFSSVGVQESQSFGLGLDEMGRMRRSSSRLTNSYMDLTISPTHSTFPRSAADRVTPRQLEAGQKRVRTSSIQNNRLVAEGNEPEE
ncbi:hypothetical protein I315_02310 [Cryptococcus gattii Ru294]|nr:hypothetical protein I315_02310 [Cryptococcus gattii Ru294]